jgi:hypothetical protein
VQKEFLPMDFSKLFSKWSKQIVSDSTIDRYMFSQEELKNRRKGRFARQPPDLMVTA